jgi:hypothetical protein
MSSPIRREVHASPPPPASPRETSHVYGRNEQLRSVHDWCFYTFPWLVTMVYAVVWGLRHRECRFEFSGREDSDPVESISKWWSPMIGNKDAWERLNEVQRRSRRLPDLLQQIFFRCSLWPDAEECGGCDLTAIRSPSR